MKVDKMPKMPISVSIEEADNGYMVSCYKTDKQVKTIHETLDGALAGAKKILGGGKKISPELKGYLKED